MAYMSRRLIAMALITLGNAQSPGTLTPETQPKFNIQQCTAAGCTSVPGTLTVDANWRWFHTSNGSTGCYNGNKWDATLCPDGKTCVKNCVLEGADYTGSYGITSDGNAVTLSYVTAGKYAMNIGSRLFLLASDTKYRMFNVLGKELSFDVELSSLGCGLNGALYFSAMDEDGGVAKYPTNTAGAKYGTGYCDAQCPRDVKFINGEANVGNWTPSTVDMNAGTGQYGTCCAEMDIWEANSISSAYTPHVCSVTNQTRCAQGAECGDGADRYNGLCDKDGCDLNTYRMGQPGFYGPGATGGIDTTTKFTVVTQFITSDGTPAGTLTEIKRKYIQNGKVIETPSTNVTGMPAYQSVTDKFCNDQKTAFNDTNAFGKMGGLAAMGQAMQKGMVLVISLWTDNAANMLWLDSSYPPTKSPGSPGVTRGTCSPQSGVPGDIQNQMPNAKVTFSNVKIGDLGTTTQAGANPAGATIAPVPK
ncbi:hypothetical protein SmJEL517_g05045 [Synchytrium microbalum]|uniref:Glucanase n=1 Tax=Synchytrium microbalum TaxID=1806994 RepID=A0A507C2D7_9FUNG|nr:uncharacterized protein SmJEL517_g05045 [Synchytrium microbalum]TPX31673.1 hypothetical protein SmJEL517_g05045 [Synchytrium microbalum]